MRESSRFLRRHARLALLGAGLACGLVAFLTPWQLVTTTALLGAGVVLTGMAAFGEF